MICGRRGETPAFYHTSKEDEWQDRDGGRACSFCGSAHPDDVFAAIEAGAEVGPTDKSYKIYIDLPHANSAGRRIVTVVRDPNEDQKQRYDLEQLTAKRFAELEATRRPGDWSFKADDIGRAWIGWTQNGPVRHAKFYFQHFDESQKRRFVDLLNEKRIKIGVPGHFYVRPFFVTYEKKTA